MKRLFIAIIAIIAICLLIPIPQSLAQECTTAACIKVYTSNNSIIIEARKGSGVAKKKVTNSIKIKPTPKATLWFPPKPTPKATLWFPPKPTPAARIIKKPSTTIKKRTATKIIVAKVSLSDRLIKMVPTAEIAYQPAAEPLINIPTHFWVDLPKIFASRVNIIGEVVDVALRPGFIWNFGDGTFYATTDAGAPYPSATISHTYKQPGKYLVQVLATWNGSYTHNGIVRAVTGRIKKTSVVLITVVSASTKFVN